MTLSFQGIRRWVDVVAKKIFSEDLPSRNLLDGKAREVLIGNEPIKSRFSSFNHLIRERIGCETPEVFLRRGAKNVGVRCPAMSEHPQPKHRRLYSPSASHIRISFCQVKST